MNVGRYFSLSVLGFMTVAGLVIFIIKLANPRRYKPMMTETGGIVPYLSIIGLLAFTTSASTSLPGLCSLAWAYSPFLEAFSSMRQERRRNGRLGRLSPPAAPTGSWRR